MAALLLFTALAGCPGAQLVSPPDPTPAADAAPPPPVQAVGHPSSELIPRATFFGNPERANVQISPDGKYLSWLAPREGVLNVWIAPVDELDEARAVTTDTARPVHQYFWAFDKKHLLYLQDQAGDEDFHVYAVDVTTAGAPAVDLTPLDKVRAFVMGVSHKQPKTILVGLNDRDPQYHDVYSVDLASGARTQVLENTEYAGFLVDDDYNVRFGVAMLPDGSSVVTELRPKRNKAAYTIEIPAGDTMTTNVEGFDRSGRNLYLVDSRGRDTGALFSVNLATGKAKLLAEDARADVGSVMTHPTKNTVQAVSFDYDKVSWKVLDRTIQKDFDALAEVAPGDFSVASRTLDDKTWVVAFRSDVQPASYYLWNRRAKRATFLFSSRPALDGLPLARMHPKLIPTRDGLTLVSYLTLPPASDPDGDGVADSAGPLVLLVHGGPWARDDWGYSGLVQMLANRGYAVLQVNFRGSTGFGKAYVNAGDKEWGKKMHEDLLDAVAWAVEAKVAPADRIGIMGGSYGGYATLAGLTLTPKVFACGVDIVGPSNLLTLIKSIPPYWAPMIAIFKTRMGDWTTPEGEAALQAVSPITHVGAIERPLLIGQGKNDPRVNQAESDQIVNAMKERGIPVTYVLFPDEGHGFHRPENSLAFFAVTEAFLSAHLGGLYQPLGADAFAGSTMQVRAGREGIPGMPTP
ncbi:MAG: S9 family peptidase [Deltaproteobacteria bacterium HGW-Deltaproteobacteria-14]|nr:MAG: S9 family peptidase [Deltaproteobacteria bacterium HGW-Deltaproteobacteria-14]